MHPYFLQQLGAFTFERDARERHLRSAADPDTEADRLISASSGGGRRGMGSAEGDAVGGEDGHRPSLGSELDLSPVGRRTALVGSGGWTKRMGELDNALDYLLSAH